LWRAEWRGEDGWVRELLYLSGRGLHRLHAERSPRWWRRRSSPDLASAIAQLERSERAPRWWADRGLMAGEWVHFEHRLNYAMLDFPGSPSVFLWSAPAAAFLAGAGVSRAVGDPAWLLLHGSPEDLVGHCPPRLPGHATRATLQAINDAATYFQFRAGLLDGEVSAPSVDDQFPARVRDVLRGLGELLPAAEPLWMAGYARVTATVALPRAARIPDRIVVATPLSVEYVDAPPFPYARKPST
jgi:hypothetical protein